jgi:mannonate dehydratase
MAFHNSKIPTRLENTWRWFGPDDPIGLKYVKQTGATGVVTALHHIPTGEVWSPDEIVKRKQRIEAEGLRWSVVESLPVHEDIKMRLGNYRRHIEHYKQSLVNLGQSGIDTICYNFMPVLDWSRTDLHVEFSDGSITTKFEWRAFAAFDLFQLRRPGAEQSYSNDQLTAARLYFDSLTDSQKETLTQTVLLGLPGSGDAYSLNEFRTTISRYQHVGDLELREHLYAFLKEIVPVAEESGVFLAMHPDDPPYPLLGLPRVVSNARDIDQLLAVSDSTSNGLTFCTGSLGAGMKNDIVSMVERFANRITFVHLRNVTKTPGGDFIEVNHLEGDVDMYGVMKALVAEQRRRFDAGRSDCRMPMRPDHGHFTLADERFGTVYPGYSLFGRMRALAELRGLELGVSRSLEH